MQVKRLHSWKVTYSQAIAIQSRLSSRLSFRALPKTPKLVAGVDVSCNRHSDIIYAGIVVLSLPDLAVVEKITVEGRAVFPYIPGLLSFRELPVVLQAFRKLKSYPDAVICDGQGIAHPRGFGLAAHCGLLLDLPTVGCAKSRLIGKHGSVSSKRWSTKPLLIDGKIVGQVVRSKAGVKPLYVSPGNNIDIPSSLQLIRHCTCRYRLPEPTRQAHLLVNRFRREKSSNNQ